MTKTYEVSCEDETFALAGKIAESAKRQDVFALIGDLGAGKTAFAKGFAKGLGVKESVVSPTFTLVPSAAFLAMRTPVRTTSAGS